MANAHQESSTRKKLKTKTQLVEEVMSRIHPRVRQQHVKCVTRCEKAVAPVQEDSDEDDPDKPLIIKILLGSLKKKEELKAALKVKKEEAVAATASATETEVDMSSHSESEVDDLSLLEKVDVPATTAALTMLKEAALKQAEGYSQLIDAIPSIDEDKMFAALQQIPGGDQMPPIIAQVYKKYGEDTFKVLLAVGRDMYETFLAKNKPDKRRQSHRSITAKLDVPCKHVPEIIRGEAYDGGKKGSKWSSSTETATSAKNTAK